MKVCREKELNLCCFFLCKIVEKIPVSGESSLTNGEKGDRVSAYRRGWETVLRFLPDREKAAVQAFAAVWRKASRSRRTEMPCRTAPLRPLSAGAARIQVEPRTILLVRPELFTGGSGLFFWAGAFFQKGDFDMKNTEKTMDKIVALCKNRGFIFAGAKFTADWPTHGTTARWAWN